MNQKQYTKTHLTVCHHCACWSLRHSQQPSTQNRNQHQTVQSDWGHLQTASFPQKLQKLEAINNIFLGNQFTLFESAIEVYLSKLSDAISMKDEIAVPEVPDFAMVPRFLIRSSLVIPIPLSRMERIFFSLSNLIYMRTDQMPSRSILDRDRMQTKMDLQSCSTLYLDFKLSSVTFTQNLLIGKGQEPNLIQGLQTWTRSQLDESNQKCRLNRC